MTPREKELLQNCKCQLALRQSRRENALLRQKIDLLVKRVFGSSSEQLDRRNWSCSPQPETNATVQSRGRAGKGTPEKFAQGPEPRLPENLPVVEEVIDPEPVKAQPEQWRCIGQEVSEQLDYEPGRFLRRRVVRRKYVHRTNP
jgi:transposase